MDPAATWGADHHRHAEVAVRAVPDPGGLAHDLVERGMDEVGELNLGYRQEPVQRHPDRHADDPGLGERRVEHPLFAELIHPAGADPEHPAAGADVLTEQHDPVVVGHLVVQGVADRGDDVLLGHDPSKNTWRIAVSASGSGASQAAVIAASISSFTLA